MHPPPKYLISKYGDPIFATIIGLASAAIKINRKEKELGHSTQETINTARRFNGNSQFLFIHQEASNGAFANFKNLTQQITPPPTRKTSTCSAIRKIMKSTFEAAIFALITSNQGVDFYRNSVI
ncbi:hypothetical protein EPUL_005397 [Erysiphe pulchra]|uniref:Uncharacterized protein n=1 Tax=Erysiphe pulchra TaxID=225359 RepID=A0A2S4PPH8_9PEZI|nr:hypothetical protein EPUL_005397 [Erysiphe pulchra]